MARPRFRAEIPLSPTALPQGEEGFKSAAGEPPDESPPYPPPGAHLVRGALLALWLASSFGVAFFARDLGQMVGGWPLNFWLLAQGSVLIFLGIVMAYAGYMNRARRAPKPPAAAAGDDAP